MISGLLAVLLGILILVGVFGPGTERGAFNGFYDSGSTSFGADFYTYVNNNAANAASATQAVARNLDEIGTMLRLVFAFLFLVFGLFAAALFGCKFAELKAENPAAAPQAGAAAAQNPGQVDESLPEL